MFSRTKSCRFINGSFALLTLLIVNTSLAENKVTEDLLNKMRARIVKIASPYGISSGVVVNIAGSDGYLALTASHNIPANLETDGRILEIEEFQKMSVVRYRGTTFNHLDSNITLPLYVPAVTSDDGEDKVKIRPKNDFGVVLLRSPHKLQNSAPHIFGVGIVPITEPDQKVLLIGAPGSSGVTNYTGTIVPAEVANQLLDTVREITPSNPVFDPKVEFLIISPRANQGMSGGAVFSEQGGLLGVIVRSGEIPATGASYVRAVRADYIANEYNSRLEKFSFKSREDFLRKVGRLNTDSRFKDVSYRYEWNGKNSCNKLFVR